MIRRNTELHFIEMRLTRTPMRNLYNVTTDKEAIRSWRGRSVKWTGRERNFELRLSCL